MLNLWLYGKMNNNNCHGFYRIKSLMNENEAYNNLSTVLSNAGILS